MRYLHTLSTSRARAVVAAGGLVAAVLAWAACNLAPQTLGIEPWACAAPGAGAGAYGSGAASGAYVAATGSAAGAGVADGGTNFVGPQAAGGAVVIADQWNNRVLVLARDGRLLFSFGDGASSPGPSSVVLPNDAELLPNGDLLIAGTGTGPVTEAGAPCPAVAGGALLDDRVIRVARSGRIVWQAGGHDGLGGSLALSAPTSAVFVPGGSTCGDDVLISDQGNRRVVEVALPGNELVWSYSPSTGALGGSKCSIAPPPSPTDAGLGDLGTAGLGQFTPQSAERLPDGNTLVTDQADGVVLEISPGGAVVWQFPPPGSTDSLDTPAFASRVPHPGDPRGFTLIADTNHDRVIVVDGTAASRVQWTYALPYGARPTGAVRLAGGDTLVTLSGLDLVVEVDGAQPPNVVYSHGQSGVPGNVGGELNQPYNAKVACDFTGLTGASPDGGCVSP